ncbi:uncharacterized protein NPIL_585951 [Nephila pilipes]|uniref:Uncharacterized protein n=1 Tax=Nephila pilipes TaxID=299642 RepID=A0A8X6R0X3_NEPPI|nr:uncharacterized protein NPIL_585951 [Nephila pilipes]
MSFHGIPPLIMILLCMNGAFAQDDGSLSNDEFLEILECVAKSGDGVLCDDFDRCNDLLISRPRDTYEACVTLVLGNDDIGKCTDEEELYGNEDNRKQINKCFIENVPEDLNEDEQKNREDFANCVRDVGDDCSSEQSR